jgi:hypothetical protein
MTRVNVGIEPENLPDELLLAELREIKRLPYFKVHCKDPQVPECFTLGKGHIKFFLPRLRYIKERYQRLREEAGLRGFTVTDFSRNFEGLDLGNDWKPEEQDRDLIIERIKERVLNGKKKIWHYYGRRITKEEVLDLLPHS